MKKLVALFLCLSFFMVGCSDKDAGEVYTSFYPINLMVKEVAGEDIPVESFMPLDKSAHFWMPSAKDMKKLARAKILYVNGAGMEPWLSKVKETLPDLEIVTLSDYVTREDKDGHILRQKTFHTFNLNLEKGKRYTFNFGHTHEKFLEVSFFKGNDAKEELKKAVLALEKEKAHAIAQKETIDVLNNVRYQLEMGHYEGEVSFTVPSTGKWTLAVSELPNNSLPYQIISGKDVLSIEPFFSVETKTPMAEGVDPHTFLSVHYAKDYAKAIDETLTKIYPEKSRQFEDNKKLFVRNLVQLERQYQDKFKTTQRKTFLVTHGAFGYLANEFGLKQEAIQVQTSEDRPSLKAIKDNIDLAKKAGIHTVFYERGGDEKGADVVASEIGGKSDTLDTMEFLPNDEKDSVKTYEDILKDNLEKLYNSLKENQ